MAELIVHNPPRAALKASGYIGSPEGDIELTENDKTYNVADFATATTRIPKPPEPTGTKEIIENGVHDVKEYAFADVKIPEPSGTIVLDENNRSYDVTDYAAADVAIPEEEKTVMPSTTRQEVTPDNGLLSKVTVLPAPLEERTVTPTIVQQTITPEAPAIGLSKVTVGAALPPPILVSKQITENRTYTAAEDNADGYSEVTVDVVGFEYVDENAALVLIDWEGTLLKSYTYDEVMALTELPNPSDLPNYAYADHEWLAFQEWNWSLTDIKGWVQDRPYGNLFVGANYTTTDGAEHIYYSKEGSTSNDNIVCVKTASTSIKNSRYRYFYNLRKINIPKDCVIESQAFRGDSSLKCVVLSKAQLGLNGSEFINTNRDIVLCNSLTYIGESSFQNNQMISKLDIPSLSYIGANAFRETRLSKIHIPDGVTYIGDYVFYLCRCLSDVLCTANHPTLGSHVFDSTNSQLKIFVPRSELQWYESATNWASIYVRINAIEDNIEYLERLGFNVRNYKEMSE